MTLARLQDITLAHGSEPLLEHADLTIDDGDRVCLVGRNGCGKSSLLRLVTGESKPESGSIAIRPGAHIGYLPQKVPRDWSGTVEQHVLSGLGEAGRLLDEYHALTAKAESGNTARIERLMGELEANDAWSRRQHADEMISLLKLDPNAPVESLSGGQSRRVLLARALAARPELLILDEPTNHLDIPSIETLEQIIKQRAKTVLFVSHDRRFVDELSTKIVEIDRGQLHEYPGSYETFLQRREERLDAEAKAAAEFDKRLAEEEAWLRQGVKARRTRNQGRLRRLLSMRDERRDRRNVQGSANIQIQEAQKSGKLVVRATEIGVTFGDEPVFENFSTKIQRGDRVGIIGPNGAGKTTLLRTLLGMQEPTSGSVEHGTRLEIAYFDQHRETLDPDAKVWEVVADGSDFVTIGERRKHVIGWLREFLFPDYRANGPVRVLSGGERHRLLLARLFAKPCNLLVLDEPTNDLDADTLELLEERVAEFDGTVMIVSHDRAFLNATVTSIIAHEGDGSFEEYVGGYDDYERQRPDPEASATTPDERMQHASQSPATEPERPSGGKKRKPSNKEREALRTLPETIEALEQEESEIHEQLADPELYRDNPDRAVELDSRLKEIAAEQEEAFERWAELEELFPDYT